MENIIKKINVDENGNLQTLQTFSLLNNLTDYEFSVIPYITDKYRDILEELKEINHFLKAVKEKL